MSDVPAWPADDADVPRFVADLGLGGILDVHVHAMPPRLQQAVWRYFDGLDDPAWPIRYRGDLDSRLATLRDLGVVAHPALAYPHRTGMLAWLNDFTLDLAAAHPQVLPTFTLYPEDGVTQAVATALDRGGVVCKVHVQVGRFHLDDERLTEAWTLLERAGTIVVCHASAVYGVDGGDEFTGGRAVGALLERHPDVRLVIAHLGLPDPDGSMWDVVASSPTTWMDVSMTLTDPPFGTAWELADEGRLARLRGELADSLLFGSDFPSIPHPYAAQVRGLAALELDRPGLRALLHDRAAALLTETAQPSESS